MKKGRPVLGAIAGFFFGLFLAVDLLIFGVIALDSILVIILPIAFLIVGIALPLIARRAANRPQETVQRDLDEYVPPPVEDSPAATPPPPVEEPAAGQPAPGVSADPDETAQP